jgi:hypothetical protein
MAQIKVRSFVKINPTPTKISGGISAFNFAAIKGINRMGGAIESLGSNLETVDKLFKFRNEFLIQSNAKRIKLEDKYNAADEKEETLSEQKQKRWWRRFLDKKAEKESEKDPNKIIDKKSDVIKKALTPLENFFKVFNDILEPIVNLFVVMPMLNWITSQDAGKLAKTIGNVITIVNFVRKLVGFGVGVLLDGLTNLFGGFDKIRQGNVAGALQGLFGVVQLFSGVALVKAAQYIFMPWKLIGDIKWMTKLFTEWGKITGEAQGAAMNKDITGYIDKNGNVISKEDLAKAKSKAAKHDAKVAKNQGKGWQYTGGQDYLGDRYRAQYGKGKKGVFSKTSQRARIAFKRGTKGVRGQFKMASNWMQANPAKGNAIFSVIGGVTRAAGGLMSGEAGGTAVGAGIGQAAGGVAGFALGNMLLPGIGGIIGSALGSFLGEWVGTKFGPMIEPIIKPIGNAFKLGFDIISPALGAIGGEAGDMFSALFDGLAALINLSTEIVKIGIDVVKFAWDNSATKKAIDAILWVWQNKDNVTRGAQGYADFLTFNLFDFDKQNKKAIGGPVVVPMMAAGGIIGTDSPEVMGLKNAGSSLVATTISTLNRLGIVGNFVKTALAPQLSVYSNLFGVASVGLSGDRLASQVRTPSADLNVGSQSAPGADNSKVRALIGEGSVTLLTAQPKDGFSPQNQKTTRGLLADIYNAFATAKFGGGTISPGGPGGDPGGQNPSSGPVVQGGSADFWSLAAIASREDVKPQGSADVAQSIYNRLGSSAYGGKTIKDIINSSGQYEPTFGNKGAWRAISDRQSAIKAAGSATNVDSSARSILNPQLQKNAVEFVQGRTDFLGETMKGNMRKDLGDITRGPGSNFFGWHNNYKKNKIASAPKFDAAIPTAAVGGLIQLMSIGGEYNPAGVPDWYDNAESRHARRTKRAKGAKKFAVGGLLSLGGSSAPGGDRKLTSNSTFANTHLHHNEPDGSPHNRALLGYGFGSPRDYVLTRGPQSMDRGTPIVAGANGKVKVLGGSLNIVELYDPSGKKLGRFLHNDKILVKDGQTVGPNTVIATQGSAGGNWPVHVHLEGSPAFQTNWIRASLGNKNLADVQGSDAQTSPTDSGGTGGKSLLEGGGNAADEFQAAEQELKKALELWAAAFGGSTTSTATALAPKTSPKVNPTSGSTSTSSQVQSGSEKFTSSEATKPGVVAAVPVPFVAPVGSSASMPTFVRNSPLPKATVS